jgi:ParB-like nuclease domain
MQPSPKGHIPAIARNSVDLPEPEGPERATFSHCASTRCFVSTMRLPSGRKRSTSSRLTLGVLPALATCAGPALQIANSIERFGFNTPVLIDDSGQIIAGHGRVAAAKLLGMESVPTLRLSHLSAADKRAYIIADNRVAEKAGWDRELLSIELQALIDIDFDIELTGFETSAVDIILEDAEEAKGRPVGIEDEAPEPLNGSAALKLECRLYPCRFNRSTQHSGSGGNK